MRQEGEGMALADYFYRGLNDLEMYIHDLTDHSPIDVEDPRSKLVVREITNALAQLKRIGFLVDDIDKTISGFEQRGL